MSLNVCFGIIFGKNTSLLTVYLIPLKITYLVAFFSAKGGIYEKNRNEIVLKYNFYTMHYAVFDNKALLR